MTLYKNNNDYIEIEVESVKSNLNDDNNKSISPTTISLQDIEDLAIEPTFNGRIFKRFSGFNNQLPLSLTGVLNSSEFKKYIDNINNAYKSRLKRVLLVVIILLLSTLIGAVLFYALGPHQYKILKFILFGITGLLLISFNIIIIITIKRIKVKVKDAIIQNNNNLTHRNISFKLLSGGGFNTTHIISREILYITFPSTIAPVTIITSKYQQQQPNDTTPLIQSNNYSYYN